MAWIHGRREETRSHKLKLRVVWGGESIERSRVVRSSERARHLWGYKICSDYGFLAAGQVTVSR